MAAAGGGCPRAGTPGGVTTGRCGHAPLESALPDPDEVRKSDGALAQAKGGLRPVLFLALLVLFVAAAYAAPDTARALPHGPEGGRPDSAAVPSAAAQACERTSFAGLRACLDGAAGDVRRDIARLGREARHLSGWRHRLLREMARQQHAARRLAAADGRLAEHIRELGVQRVAARRALVEAEEAYRRALPELAGAIRGTGEAARRAQALLVALGQRLAQARVAAAQADLGLAQLARLREVLAGAGEASTMAREGRRHRLRTLHRTAARIRLALEQRHRILEELLRRRAEVDGVLAVADRTARLQLGLVAASFRSGAPAVIGPAILPPPSRLLAEQGHARLGPARMGRRDLRPIAALADIPVAGRVLARFGEPIDGIPSRGITLAVREPVAVRPLLGGRVVFAGRLRGLGLVLILDHGGGYHGVFAGLGRSWVKRGAELRSGELLGVALPARGQPGRLYVELRYRGRPVDPLRGLVALVADRHSG